MRRQPSFRASHLPNSPIARALLICCCGAFALLLSAGGRTDAPSPVRFREHVIDVIPNAYHCVIADINGDGKPDILAISETQSVIAWYENPTWKKHVFTTHAPRPIDIAAYDPAGRGKPDIFVNTGFYFDNTHEGGQVLRFTRTADPNAEWTSSEITTIPTAHRLRLADWDGSGKKDLVVVPILGPGAGRRSFTSPVSIMSFELTPSGATPHLVDRTLTVVHGACVLDFDGKGRDDLLTASAEGLTLFRPVGKGAKRTWTKTHLADGHQRDAAKPASDEGLPGTGCGEIERGFLRRGHRQSDMFLATIEPYHGAEVCVYLRPRGGKGPWERHVIDDSLSVGHALVCVDLDGDGRDEIVAGGRGGTRSLYGYRRVSEDGTRWERFTIDSGDMPAAGAAAADLFGHGRPDLVAAGNGNGKIKIYENLGP